MDEAGDKDDHEYGHDAQGGAQAHLLPDDRGDEVRVRLRQVGKLLPTLAETGPAYAAGRECRLGLFKLVKCRLVAQVRYSVIRWSRLGLCTPARRSRRQQRRANST